MANVTITQLPNAGAITGTELVPVVQNGVTVHTTASALAGSPVQTQTFLTLNNEPTLNNSRSLGVSSGLSLTDGGAQGALTINLSGAVANFNALGAGVVVKTGTSTLAARTFTTSGLGLSITNGDGVAGNPTLQLTGIAAAIASSSGTGMLAIVGGSTIANRAITGTADQIVVADGNGAANPTISLFSNPIVPGLAGITIPVGASSDRSVSAGVGTIRYSTTLSAFEGYTSVGWGIIVAGPAITTFSAGTTGLTPNTPSTGPIVLGGTLLTTSGGTGLAAYTAGDLPYYASGTALSTLAIGTNGYILQSNGSAPVWVLASSVVGGAGGATTQVQYNNAGLLAGSANMTFNGTVLTSSFEGPLNGTVGATTANTGAFTTLTTSSTVTLNGGTTNGVAYLNGSKVLTTGSALTFDGRVFTVDASSGNAIVAAKAIVNQAAFLSAVGNGNTQGSTSFDIIQDQSFAYVFNRANTPMLFGVNNAERMRLTSTGLGIGRTPVFALDAQSAVGAIARLRSGATYGSGFFGTLPNSDTSMFALSDKVNTTGGTAGQVVALYTNTLPLVFEIGVEKMRLDTSGNLGLGVTPSAWDSGWKAIDIAAMSAYTGSASGTDVWNNSRVTATVAIYKTTAAASFYRQTTGQHVWYNAPSGTAGNAITFTQAMTLDASGNLLVGTTATYGGPGRINVGFNQSTNFGITLRNTNAAATGVFVSFENSAGGGNGSISQVNSSSILYNTSSDYRLKNITGPITTSGAYIDSLKPVEGTWKADGSTFVGLIAHETQEASRTTVATGTKDGADMQGMDYSSAEIIANLIAELQSLRARVAQLESK